MTSSLTRVDARGLWCPEPVVRARIALQALAPGDRIELVATDPHAELDIEVFCATSGHQLLQVERRDDEWRFEIARAASP
ncbi:MAG: sulfurtransferase TusA family protein [Pseudomonadota bacterium]